MRHYEMGQQTSSGRRKGTPTQPLKSNVPIRVSFIYIYILNTKLNLDVEVSTLTITLISFIAGLSRRLFSSIPNQS